MENKRQGDVLISKINKLPQNLKRVKNNTLAYGEISGHHHTLVPMIGTVETFKDSLGNMYFEVSDKAVLLHTNLDTKTVEVDKAIEIMIERINKGADFHKPQEVGKGIYKVTQENDYNPFTKLLERARD